MVPPCNQIFTGPFMWPFMTFIFLKMKFITRISALAALCFMASMPLAQAQLFSSGNNLILSSNVGIGTSSPASKLQVEGNITQVSQGPVGAPTSRWTGLGDPPPGFSSPNVGNTYGANINWSQRNAYFGLLQNGSTFDAFLAWQDQTSTNPNIGNALRIGFINGVGSSANFTERGTWLANGNLGIGEANPSARLEIKGEEDALSVSMILKTDEFNGDSEILLSENPNNNFGFRVQYDGSGTPNSVDANSGNQLRFISREVSTQNTRMVINRSNGRVGIGTTNPGQLLEVNGNAAKPGGGMWAVASDRRLKKKVRQFEDGLDVLMDINPVWFQYKENMNMPANQDYVGTIAQDLRKAAPYMVHDVTFDAGNAADVEGGAERRRGYMSADYSALMFVMVNAIKEQQAIIENQEAKMAAQEVAMEELRAQMRVLQKGNDSNDDRQAQPAGPATLPGDLETVELFQNKPNPFNQATEISYVLPANVQRAQLYIYDLNGSQIQSFELTDRGRSSVTVQGSSLQAGMYIYTLIADGQEMATKRMILTR